MKSRFSIILIALVVIFGGILLFSKKDASAPTGDSSGTLTNHTFGEGKSGVTLVEYGDFECPGCAAYYPLVKEIKTKYNEQITFQFRNFPLSSIHPNAMAAHRAAHAASKQGKFWEMHDLLYESQNSWNASSGTNFEQATKIFEGYAAQLSLNIEQYKTDRDSAETNAAIQADVAEGNKQDVSSTPTFFLDGKKVDTTNFRGADDFYKVIDDAIKAKTQPQ